MLDFFLAVGLSYPQPVPDALRGVFHPTEHYTAKALLSTNQHGSVDLVSHYLLESSMPGSGFWTKDN